MDEEFKKVRDRIEQEEIMKWRGKLDEILPKIKPVGGKGEEFLKNIKAYATDTDHFMRQGDFVNAFEASLWAWAYCEAGLAAGVLEQ